MKMRRVLTAFLAVLMLVSLVPAAAFAAGGSGETTNIQPDQLYLDKKATLTDDGSYTINLEAFATGQTTSQIIEKGVPLDIVLVLDQSGSMTESAGEVTRQEALQTAAKNFVEKVYQDGKKHNVEHRIGIATFAGGNGSNEQEDKTYWYLHTGIYDENGNFVGYEDTASSKPTYVKFNGTMDPKGAYFVKVNGKYVQLTYNKGTDNYEVVGSPATDRTDLYGKVNGKYEKATYGEYTVKTEITKPTQGSETYYDANGNPLTWKEITVPGQPSYEPIKGTIQSGKAYYIKHIDNTYHKIWEHGNKSYWRDDTQGNYAIAYEIDPNNKSQFVWKGDIFGGLQYYPAYEQIPGKDIAKTVLTTADGKEYTGKVYTRATKTGWNVNGTAVDTVYELVKGASKWQYEKGKKTVDYTNEQVYIQKTASVFGPALVPVADDAGTKQTNFDKAIDSLAAEGPTRTAKGVEMGNKIFEANPIPAGSERQRIMIVFTDGQPGWSGYDKDEASAAVQQTDITKGTYGAKVYTIGLYDTEKSEQKTFMENMSSTGYTYTEVTKPDTSKEYWGEVDGTYVQIEYYKKGKTWRTVNGKKAYTGTIYEQKNKYYHMVKDAAALDSVFQSIQQDISSSTSKVDLTTDSILRDIMAKDFEMTSKTVITVSVVPGTADKTATENKIIWGDPTKVLTLENVYNGAFATGTYKNMTIKATTYMENPEVDKANHHTVDVTGFNYKDQYIAKEHAGSKLVVEITGVKALTSIANDQNVYTNYCNSDPTVRQSGIWAPAKDGKYSMKAPFPQRPKTYMPSKNYVVDYAKPLELDLKQIKMNGAVDVDMKGYEPFITASTKIDHKYGDVKLEGGKLTYSPKTMNWDGYDTFYVFGTTGDATVKKASANANGNVWSKVQVIPANNVYYEDTFISNESNGTVGITYTGDWTEVKDATAGKNPGAETSNDNHGWIPVLDGEKGDTDGSSHHADVTGNKTAIAKFTFTGTGVDVYSRTNGKTGTINVKLMDADGKSILRTYVDTLSASGEYYQIPTLSLYEDSKGVALPYGTYTVEIRVSTAAEGRYEYYLDGIRVYNPMNGGHEAYAPNEKNATFMEVRDMLLDANSFSAEENGVSHGFVFIDQLNNGTDGAPGTSGNTKAVGVYKDLGPKNEVYLKKGQMVSFKVNTTAGNQFQIGLKSPTGNPVQAAYTNEMGSPVETFEISHTADMYYSVGAASNGVISIMNSSNELLAITKLKVTNEAATVATAEVFEATDVPTLLSAAQDFADQPVNPNPDVDIENPDVPGGDQKPEKPHIVEVIHKIFEEIRGWFGR